jgi:glycosyltransferase involved in cell wall biosynthesis
VKISATIITFNEEKNIARAIESLRCADEILVVDSGSTDRTVELAEKHGARVLERNWTGYADQKNWAAAQAANDWILSLDADEALSEMLEAEIWQWKKNGPTAKAYTMPRQAQYLGQWIRYSGWYPDRKIRLYDRRAARWEGKFVHEGLKVEGRIGAFESTLLHFTCQSLSEHLRTMDRYTTLAAEQLVEQGARISVGQLLWKPWWEFIRTYFLKRGFLDGAEGLAIAWMGALYVFLKYAKARYMLPGRQ